MDIENQKISEIAYFGVNIAQNTYPVLEYLSELKRIGYSIDYYGPRNDLEHLFSEIVSNDILIDNFPETNDITRSQRAMLHACFEFVPKVEKAWKSGGKPQLIVADRLAYPALILAKRNGVRMMVFENTFLNFSDCTGSVIANATKSSNLSSEITALREEVCKRYGLNLNFFGEMAIKGDQNVSFIPDFWGKLISPAKKANLYLGPSFQNEDLRLFSDFNPDKADIKDSIYVSLEVDSENSLTSKLLDNIIEALQDTKHNVIISTSSVKAKQLKEKSLPKNIRVYNSVPQLHVLENAKLFITQMNTNECMKALYKGVPLIGIPSEQDQLCNTVAMEKLNIGVRLENLSTQYIKNTIGIVLNSSEIKANLKKYSSRINPKDSAQDFCEAVMTLIFGRFG